MVRYWIFGFVFILVSCGISIEVATRRVEKFDENHDKIADGLYPNYQLIQSMEVDEKVGEGCLLVSWSPWCPWSLNLLDTFEQYVEDSTSQCVYFITTSYDVKSLDKVLTKRPNLSKRVTYVVNGKTDGSNELDRMRNLSKTLIDTMRTNTPNVYMKTDTGFMLIKGSSLDSLLLGGKYN